MKLVPIVKIVEIDRVFRRRAIIGESAVPKNVTPRFVVVIVSADGGVVLFDRDRV